MNISRRLFCGAAATAGVVPAFALGKASFPDRPVRLLVPLSPGGTADATARLIAQKLSILWGQPVIVENRAGGAGVIAMDALSHAKADGYTLGMGNINTIATNPLLRSNLSYDPRKDLCNISWLTTSPLFLIVSPSLGVDTLARFVAYAKANPGRLSYASVGVGSSMHLAMEMLQRRAGIELLHVQYKGMAAAVQDLISGNVQSTLDISTMAMVHAGKLRALGVASDKRYHGEPTVPSFAESGLSGLELVTWLSLHGPAGLPLDLVQRISADVDRVLSLPDVRSQINDMNLDPIGGPPGRLDAFVRAEREKYAEIIRRAHITVE